MFPSNKKFIKHNDRLFSLLFTEDQIRQTVNIMGSQINEFYKDFLDVPITVIAVLQKSVMFFSDLQKNFTFLMVPEFIFERDLHEDKCQEINFNSLHFEVLKNKHVLLVSNSFEKNSLLQPIVNKINESGPKSLSVAILISHFQGKLNTLQTWIGSNSFEIPEKLVGYGFDSSKQLTALPQIY